MGEAKKIVESISVNKVIFNVGSYNYLEKDLIKALKRKNIKYYKNIENIYIRNTPILFSPTLIIEYLGFIISINPLLLLLSEP